MEKGTKEVSLKPKKEKAAKVADSKNLDNAKAKITKEKDLMYNYPKSATELGSRKQFRHEVRRKVASFKRQIGKAEGKEAKAALITEANAYAATVYAPGHLVKF